MRKRSYIFHFLMLAVLSAYVSSVSSCANIIPPGGGPKDSLAPILLSAVPKDSTRHFSGNRIVLHFDEYVTLDNTQENVIVSPNAKNQPQIEGKLRTVTIRLKDSLEANTTYSINFGKSIKDVNEGNIAKEFTYVFSTGSTIDSCFLAGTVQLAQTGKTDSTLIVVLHSNLDDTAVSRSRPRYYTKLDGHGHFRFNNLPPAQFAVYVIPNDYNKRFDDSTKLFAFLDSSVTVGMNTPPIKLYAFQEYVEKPKPNRSQQSSGNNKKKEKDKEKEEDKRLKLTGTSLSAGEQDLLTPLYLGFNRPLQSFDSSKMVLTDTNYAPLPIQPRFSWTDTTATKITLTYPWKAESDLRLLISKEAATDSGGVNIHKSDTLELKVKKESAYGSIKLHFNGIDFERHPVLQILQSDKVVDSIAITDKNWFRRLYAPGDYELRILYDNNHDGTWTPGRFWESKEKAQPELVYPAKPAKVTVRGNWDNEWDVTLGDPFEVPEQKKPAGRPGQRSPR